MNRSLRVLALAAAMTGCRGSTGAGEADARMPVIAEVPAGVLLREQQPRFSPEIMLLGSRAADDVWIPLALLSEIEGELALIRKTYPVVAQVELPVLPADLLFVTLKPGVAFADAWSAGRLETGEAELDALLRHFNAVSVSRSFGTTFEVTFAQWLNLDRLSSAVQATSSSVEFANRNFLFGAPAELRRLQAAGNRVYTFVRGCETPDGCSGRPTWIVRIAGDGSLTMHETTT
jgi:hypothetical protein